MRWKDCRKDRAVTLMELLLSTAIVGILFVAHMGIMGQSRVIQKRAEIKTSLTLKAHSQMEQLRDLPYNALEIETKTFTVEEIPKTECTVSIEETELKDVKKCKVTVVHHGLWGDETISLVLLRSRSIDKGTKR